MAKPEDFKSSAGGHRPPPQLRIPVRNFEIAPRFSCKSRLLAVNALRLQHRRGLRARCLTSYRIGETTLVRFLSDAGIASPSDSGTNGWRVTHDSNGVDTFRVEYDSQGNASWTGRAFRALLADLEFKAGVLASFSWNN